MIESIYGELKGARVLHGLTLGTARAKLEAPPALTEAGAGAPERWPLIAAALLGQESRYAWPAAPNFTKSSTLPAPTKPLLPNDQRMQLRRLVPLGKEHFGWLEAIWFYLERSGYSLHPFDFAALKPLLKADGAPLGSTEEAWLERSAGSTGAAAADDNANPTEDDRWLQLTPAGQGDFVRSQRRLDPDRGRALIEQGLAKQAAAVRCRLVEALEVGLSEDDVELLRSLGTDRAKSVREAGSALLARLPGTPEYKERVEDAVSLITVGKRGLTRGKKALRLRSGSGNKAAAYPRFQEYLRYVTTDDFAEAFELTVKGLYESVGSDARLQTALMSRAVIEGMGRAELAAKLLRSADLWAVIQGLAGVDADTFGGADAAGALRVLLKPAQWTDWPAGYSLLRLVQFNRGPLPVDVAQELLGCGALDRAIQSALNGDSKGGILDPTSLLALVHLTPTELHPLVEERLAPLSSHQVSIALELIRFASSLASREGLMNSHD